MNWELKTLRVDLQSYGEFKGKYVGKIEFGSGNNAFTFDLSTEETREYIALIAKKVGRSAASLGEQITESLKAIGFNDQPLIEIKETHPD